MNTSALLPPNLAYLAQLSYGLLWRVVTTHSLKYAAGSLRILAPIDHNGQRLSGKNSEIERGSSDDTGNAD